jgi:CTP:molybdopterin cytidylyltransferase MocA
MGAFKPLLPLGEVTVVERVIHLFRSAGIHEICVVTGHRSGELGARLAGAGVATAENPHYAEGMFSSIRTGMAKVPTPCRGLFLLPVDIPLVRPATLHLLMEAFRRHAPADTTVHPVYAGERGHPPLIPASLIPAILSHTGRGGLRALLEAPGARAREVPVPDRFILQDMDRPEGYAALQQELAAHPIPDEGECEALLQSVRGVRPAVLRHSRRVAGAAIAIGKALCKVGQPLNLALVQAGALLHDVAKGESRHARRGSAYLRRLGFGQVADVVAQHDDLHMETETEVNLNEAAVVFIADKQIRGEELVTLEKRFAVALEHFGANPAARRNILRRRETARRIGAKIEALTGRRVPELIRAPPAAADGVPQVAEAWP